MRAAVVVVDRVVTERLPLQEAQPAGIARDPSEEPHQHVAEITGDGFGVELGVGLGEAPPEHLAVEAVLPAEVVGDELLVHPGAPGDRLDPRARRAPGGELLERRLEQPLTAGAGVIHPDG